jgi:hypothetical protein
MHHKALREIAKVGTGLILADLIGIFMFSGFGFFPLSMLGVTWTGAMVPEMAVFDVALLVILTHFGWNMRTPVSSPSERTLLLITGIIFLVLALAHLIRLMFGIDFILGDFQIPAWISWVGVAVAAYLSYSCFHFAARAHRSR